MYFVDDTYTRLAGLTSTAIPYEYARRVSALLTARARKLTSPNRLCIIADSEEVEMTEPEKAYSRELSRAAWADMPDLGKPYWFSGFTIEDGWGISILAICLYFGDEQAFWMPIRRIRIDLESATRVVACPDNGPAVTVLNQLLAVEADYYKFNPSVFNRVTGEVLKNFAV